MNDTFKKLDNPVWYSLAEDHQKFAINFDNIKFYHPDHCPFGGSLQSNGIARNIDEYSNLVNNFFVVGEKPAVSDKVFIKQELVCFQMVIKNRIQVDQTETIIPLASGHAEKLYQLVQLVQPGYFKIKTILLGNYFGIFKDDQLVAAAGERMRMNGFVEVSAIVTHPAHTGKGYAKQLTAYVVNNIIEQYLIPYLHVVETNIAAIKLYEKLGFETRRKISFWNIEKHS